MIAHLPLRYGEVQDPYPNKRETRRLPSHVSASGIIITQKHGYRQGHRHYSLKVLHDDQGVRQTQKQGNQQGEKACHYVPLGVSNSHLDGQVFKSANKGV